MNFFNEFDEKLRGQLPTGLKDVEIMIFPHLYWEPAVVTFRARGRQAELEIDPDIGLTELQVAHLCAVL